MSGPTAQDVLVEVLRATDGLTEAIKLSSIAQTDAISLRWLRDARILVERARARLTVAATKQDR